MTLSRKTPMSRGSGFKAKAAPAGAKLAAVKKPVAEPKPAKGPRKTRCKVCKSDFLPPAPWVKHCSTDCGVELGLTLIAKQKAKAQRQERAQDNIQVQQDGMKKSIAEWAALPGKIGAFHHPNG